MTYSSFSVGFLLAAYQEVEAGKDELCVGDVLDLYDLKGKPGWSASAIEEFAAKGWLENDPTLGDERQLVVIFRGAGLREAERLLSSGMRVTRRPSTLVSIKDMVNELPDSADIITDSAEPQVAQSIDSSAWTGLPSNFALGEERRARLVSTLDTAEKDLESLGVGNEVRAQARAYIIAIKALAEAPDPPIELIWELIGKANKISGIASLFVSIIALFAASH